MDAQSRPNHAPAPVQPQYRREIVHTPQAMPPFWQRHSTWIFAGIGGLSLLAIAIALFTGGDSATYQPEPVQRLDKDAIVAGAADRVETDIFNSTEQLHDFRTQLLSQEATRYQQEAAKQIQDPEAPCYRQPEACVFDQFSLDAIAQIEQARSTQDYQQMLLATARVEAVELARSGLIAEEPESSLTQLAIQNLVEAHRRLRSASAEAKAAEVMAE
jgi:hypothetical protein